MALVIETGAGVAGANSYASVLELKAFASNRGLEIPAVTGDLEKALVLACDKLETSAAQAIAALKQTSP